MQRLSPRQQSILNRVVDTHIDTGEPVGSGAITALFHELYRSSYSPATVRHEMGFLENHGYLTHPHTSAGRLPTDLGYRYYVDHGLRQEILSDDLFRKVFDDLTEASQEMESFAEAVSQFLSTLSEEVSLVLIPAVSSRKNKRSKGFKLYLWGASHMLEKPEFRDMKKIGELLKTFEEKTELTDWLVREKRGQKGVCITIGEENTLKLFRDCTMVSMSYAIRGEGAGLIAVMGPRRMRYSRAIPLVNRMGYTVEKILEQRDPEVF